MKTSCLKVVWQPLGRACFDFTIFWINRQIELCSDQTWSFETQSKSAGEWKTGCCSLLSHTSCWCFSTNYDLKEEVQSWHYDHWFWLHLWSLNQGFETAFCLFRLCFHLFSLRFWIFLSFLSWEWKAFASELLVVWHSCEPEVCVSSESPLSLASLSAPSSLSLVARSFLVWKVSNFCSWCSMQVWSLQTTSLFSQTWDSYHSLDFRWFSVSSAQSHVSWIEVLLFVFRRLLHSWRHIYPS